MRLARGPYDAKIFADGRPFGSAGDQITLSAGKHRIAVMNDALFVRVEAEITVPAGQETIWKPAWPQLGVLHVTAIPTNCVIDVRAKHDSSFRTIDDTIPVDYKLAAGSYTVRCTQPKTGQSQEQDVDVIAGFTAPLDFTFR